MAIIWEGDEPTLSRSLTYGELKKEVSRIANVMKLKVFPEKAVLSIKPPIISCYQLLNEMHVTAIHNAAFTHPNCCLDFL